MIAKEQAVAKALEMGRGTYEDIDELQMTVEEGSEAWQVNFTRSTSLADGERQHFSVWVNKKTGAAQLFKGR